jgi:hypothetical protein
MSCVTCPYFVPNNTEISVADPDPNPGSGMGKKSRSGSGMNIPDHISESLEKNIKFFDMDPDPGSWIRNLFDPESGIRNKKIRIRDKHFFFWTRTLLEIVICLL